MTRLVWAARCARALLTVSFTLAVVGTPGLHRCPAHAMHARMAHGADVPHGSHRQGHESSRCTCVGSCCTVSLAHGAGGITRAAPATLQPPRAPGFQAVPQLATSRVRLLPFATAPPSPAV